MHALDYALFLTYMVAVVGIGYHFYRTNVSAEDFYVGGRKVAPTHVGLSIVATDVGGGFSIGLGGLGFAIGLAGSWLLFTGLAGAWLSAVLVLPRIKRLDARHGMMTYPDFLRLRYGQRVALLAAIISGIGYLGFTGAQVLAGAKLAVGTILPRAPWGLDPLQFALYVIAVVVIAYTVMGGIKAVIFTDTVQWIILLGGLAFLGLPLALRQVGGFSGLAERLPPGHFSLTNLAPATFVNWMLTIIPIWFLAMTLYQRMYAVRDVAAAKKAWYIAGLLEYPVMAFLGVLLGMCARVMFPEVDPEMGVPVLIKTILPVGVAGILVASYFSAIMSTADSCLMASSGNVVNDILHRYFFPKATQRQLMRLSQGATLAIGVLAIVMAASFETVLDAILHAYGFMVSGLFIPTLAALFWRRPSATAAFWSMVAGGGLSLWSAWRGVELPWGLDATVYGIAVSAAVFAIISLAGGGRRGSAAS